MAILYKISKEAEIDWNGIVRYTLEKYGKRQVEKYTNRLLRCLDELVNNSGPNKNLNIAGRIVLIKYCQKHYIFALNKPDQPLLIIAVFHEQMNLMQRLKGRFD